MYFIYSKSDSLHQYLWDENLSARAVIPTSPGPTFPTILFGAVIKSAILRFSERAGEGNSIHNTGKGKCVNKLYLSQIYVLFGGYKAFAVNNQCVRPFTRRSWRDLACGIMFMSLIKATSLAALASRFRRRRSITAIFLDSARHNHGTFLHFHYYIYIFCTLLRLFHDLIQRSIVYEYLDLLRLLDHHTYSLTQRVEKLQ